MQLPVVALSGVYLRSASVYFEVDAAKWGLYFVGALGGLIFSLFLWHGYCF